MNLKVNNDTCMGCGACAGLCNFDGVTLHETRIEFTEGCNECGWCARGCPVGAIETT
ncbi:MAG: 4Fe-4S binding protein [Thermoplasmata archaeon]|nr:MAG: 4Fe-4S binding protein [Thermoplasmata archaeon]